MKIKRFKDQSEFNEYALSQILQLKTELRAAHYYIIAMHAVLASGDKVKSQQDRALIARNASASANIFAPDDEDGFVAIVEKLCGMPENSNNVVEFPSAP